MAVERTDEAEAVDELERAEPAAPHPVAHAAATRTVSPARPSMSSGCQTHRAGSASPDRPDRTSRPARRAHNVFIRDRPLILINCWRRELPTYLGERTRLDTLDPAYAERVHEAGGRALLVSRPPDHAAVGAEELLQMAGGLLLTGGGDVDPASYSAIADNVADVDPAADGWELALLEAARRRAMPTLAVCRGAQLLAVAHGGSLAQRLAPSAGHREPAGMTAEEILSARHPVALAAGSRVRAALGGRQTVTVNTIHHHQIADAGSLRVTATAPGGSIEAVEPDGAWECVGVQWHPEKMPEPEQRGLFEALVGAAVAQERVAA